MAQITLPIAAYYGYIIHLLKTIMPDVILSKSFVLAFIHNFKHMPQANVGLSHIILKMFPKIFVMCFPKINYLISVSLRHTYLHYFTCVFYVSLNGLSNTIEMSIIQKYYLIKVDTYNNSMLR